MYYIVKVRDVVRIPPKYFNQPLEKITLEILRNKYEGLIDNELGIIIAILTVDVSPYGRIVHGDGASYHHVTFEALAFIPTIQEVIEGEVIDVTDFGVFIRLGPVDGLIHVSQIMDDYIVYDKRSGILQGKSTARTVKKGDIVRARIVTASLSKRGVKIGLTMRQPFLGVLSWIEEDIKKLSEKGKGGK
ncbi:MAG: DNA-directed RNA polymerase [Candidatus Methanomethylicia archaeon]|nr:DNA-directed RNA polymerase [Candidatus Methanomethylicia archaeon]MCX8169061.1 DNA-directed RNA polymerase [Candidatus Methanomethylicia archaeon]MDW7988793.1 DNA-directed RNA polymerase [Nitrososphaerota archaeon]